MYKPHKRLDVWRLSMELVRKTYCLTAAYPQAEKYGLAAQMRRAAVGVPSNLAEGAARASRKEFGQFLSFARGSLSELDTQLDLSEELCLISNATRREFDPMLVRVDQMLYALQKRQKRSPDLR
jgi:four helix bundle protein